MNCHPHALIHEIWLDPEPDGQRLPGLCLAGPMGDGFRQLLNPGATMTGTIEGTSHFAAMTQYWARMGWGPYRADCAAYHAPYPTEWVTLQRRALQCGDAS